MNKELRKARFTSSNMHKLIPRGKRKMTDKEKEAYKKANPGSRVATTECDLLFAAPGLTYIEEKVIEHLVQNSIDDTGAYSQSMAWGKLMEIVVFETSGMEYRMTSKETKEHPKYGKFWSGSADMRIPEVLVSEIKCYQYKEFSRLTDVLLSKSVERLREERPSEYWQVVSNAAIDGVYEAEIISYMPFKSELEKLRGIIEESNFLERNGMDPWQYRFIVEKPINQLASLPDNGYYNNLNKFRFKIPTKDLKYLEKRVVLANKFLKEGIDKYNI